MSIYRWVQGLRRAAPMTFAICAGLVLVYLLTALQAGSIGENLRGSSLGQSWLLYGPAFAGHPALLEALRAIGSITLHWGPEHLAMNVLTIYLVGRELERGIGAPALGLSFLAAGLGGSSAVLWGDPIAATAGASGAGYGLMALAVGLARRRRIDARPFLVLLLANVGFTFIAPGVSVYGHLGGLVVGAVLAVVLGRVRRTATLVFTAAALCLLLFALCVVLSVGVGATPPAVWPSLLARW